MFNRYVEYLEGNKAILGLLLNPKFKFDCFITHDGSMVLVYMLT
jgi:hypothetical protein